MPSRKPLQSSPLQPPHNTHSPHLIPSLAVAGAGVLSILIVFIFFYRKLTLSRRTAPLDEERETHRRHQQQSPELRRFSFSQLRKLTSSFSPSYRVGQGGFGSVYRATLPDSGETVAVKIMETSGTIQGEREFHNEICLANRVISTVASPFLVSILGYSCGGKRGGGGGGGERKLLVYEFMVNGSLQEKLLESKCVELSYWERRYKVILDVARALYYLHCYCGPTPVVHGDVKPSNVLLDDEFNAKLGDFGLATVLDVNENDEARVLIEIDDVDNDNRNDCVCNDGNSTTRVVNEGDNGSIMEEEGESESVVTTVERSPTAGSNMMASPSEGFERASSLPESWMEKMSVESGKIGKKKNWGSGRDYWWWKQDNGGGGSGGVGSESGRVKDYVMEWIGSEIKKERPKSSDLIGVTTPNSIFVGRNNDDGEFKVEGKKQKKKRLDWWRVSFDEDKFWRKREKNRRPREWWKEEFCEELSKKSKVSKKKKKTGAKSSGGSELWWQRDEDFIAPERKKRRKSKSSLGSIDWWLDGLSGELRGGRRNSHDWASGDNIPKSGGISSTPSMRGTVCYIAPEYGGGGQLSEKCDVYSFGVLVLVIISGRRPLQVLASPMSEFERANLVSWARQLAYNGKLLDLVDTSIQSLDKDQAMLCITIALLCLQRSPCKRPNMKEIVEMLTGEADPPHLPFEFSPSPPSMFPFKSRKKGQ